MNEYILTDITNTTDRMIRDRLKSFVPNILSYYSERLDNPKFITEGFSTKAWSNPSVRPNLEGLNVVVCELGCNMFPVNWLYYASDDNAKSIHIAIITDDEASTNCSIRLITNFNQCISKYRKYVANPPDPLDPIHLFSHKYQSLEKLLNISNVSFLPRQFERLLNSLTIHVFKTDGTLVI